MEIIFKIIGISLITTISILLIKPTKPDIAMIVGLAGGVFVFFYIIDLIEDVFGLFNYIMEITNLDSKLFTILIKMIGVGYITEFSANLCKDSGNLAMAGKLLLAGKLVIFVMAIPIITSLIELIVSIMP
ncbi:MAG: stage III sporulation protein AD [Clostridia bacterium]|nr:stage III sporulation protein AD [Clostridia bacterium]